MSPLALWANGDAAAGIPLKPAAAIIPRGELFRTRAVLPEN